MTSPREFLPPESTPPGPRAGLRLRLWFACLAPAAAAGAGIWVGLAVLGLPGWNGEPRELLIRIGLALAPALLIALVVAIWLDRGIVSRVRALTRSLGSGQMAQRHGQPLAGGWGELGDLTAGLQTHLYRQRQLARAGEDLQRLQRQIESVREAVERWVVTERWEPVTGEPGSLRLMTERLNQGFARAAEVTEQNQQAAVQVRNDLLGALDDARESAEQAEHGFVEATALLTTVRELQRLSGELQNSSLAPTPAPGPATQAAEQWRASAAGAIEELTGAASASVEHLGSGLMRVHEIAEQVQLLANRATLIALNAVIGSAPERGGAPLENPAGEMKQLAREVRAATERVTELSREIERGVESATERMRGLRERVASRLEQNPSVPVESVPLSDDVRRLLDRVREMVQDATRKCERLSAAGERSSRAADALVQKLEDGARDMEGLAVRMSPTGAAAVPREGGPHPANLRVLESGPPEDDDTGAGERENRP